MSNGSGRTPGIGRRAFVKRAGLGAAAVAMAPRAAFAQGLKKVTFTLPWLADGNSLFMYVGLEKGMWSKRGIDMEVTRGFGSVASALAIGEGKFDFGMSAAPTALLQVAKGLPLVSIGCCTYNPAMGVGVLKDSPIKTPKDLEGKKMGSVVSSGEYPFLPVFAERAGFDLSKVTIVQVDNKIRETSLIAGQVDAISAFATSAITSIAAKGKSARFFLYNDYKMPFYGQMLLTQQKRFAEDPATCQAVAEGCMEAVQWTMANPEESMKIFFGRVKEAALTAASREQIRLGLGLFVLVNLVDVVRSKGIGYSEPAAFVEMTKLVMDNLAKPGDKQPDLDAFLINKYVEGKYFFNDAQWAAMKKHTAEFAGFLS